MRFQVLHNFKYTVAIIISEIARRNLYFFRLTLGLIIHNV